MVAQMDTIQWNEGMREHTRSTVIGKMSLEVGEFSLGKSPALLQQGWHCCDRLHRAEHFDEQGIQMRPTQPLPLQNFQAIDIALGCSSEPEARCGKASGAINLNWLVLPTWNSHS